MCIRRHGFVIFPEGKQWIVYNTRKEFATGHSHLRNKRSAIAAADFAHKKKIPKRCGNYYLESLARISNDEGYSQKVRQLIQTRLHKGNKKYYINSQKGVRR